MVNIRSITLNDNHLEFFQKKKYNKSAFIKDLIENSEDFKEWKNKNAEL